MIEQCDDTCGAESKNEKLGLFLCRATVAIVDFSARHSKAVIIAGLLLGAIAAVHAVQKFSVNTNVEDLFSTKLGWHERQIALSDAFPQRGLLAVLRAPTVEEVEGATDALVKRLTGDKDHFGAIIRPDSGEFFDRNGILFRPTDEVTTFGAKIGQLRPLVSILGSDPSLRGALQGLTAATQGVKGGQLQLDQLSWPLTLTERTFSAAASGATATFSWQALLDGKDAPRSQLHRFIEIEPKLDFSALQPGKAATDAVRAAADDLKLSSDYHASLDLTGEVALNDDQFSVIQDSAMRDTLIAGAGVLLILWLALHSWRIIAAVFLSLVVGLAITASLGLLLVGSFNLISVAFFVLFVGIGVDFGIQFSVRYRSERHHVDDVNHALRLAAGKVGRPLTLAAAATAIGFFSFYPTSYRGLSELGIIAGFGMLIAFFTSVTLVPAALALLKPPGEPSPLGFALLAPIDHSLQKHRIPIVIATMLVLLAGSPLLFRIPFDTDPMNLQNPDTPSVKAYRELQNDPSAGGNDAEVLAPSLDAARAIATKLSALPEVARVITLASFVPDDQPAKRSALTGARQALFPALRPPQTKPAPTDADDVNALRGTAAAIEDVAAQSQTPTGDLARRVVTLMKQLADGGQQPREALRAAVVPSLKHDLVKLAVSLDPQTISLSNLPHDIMTDWKAADGRFRVQALPKSEGADAVTADAFAKAVLAAEPNASGAAIVNLEAANAVLHAFFLAGAFALGAITILLLVALRRVSDILLTLVPLLLAGVAVLEICVLTGLTLNFANIIALPLLLGIGVAFKIYYVMAWRAGKSGLLQSALTRAVIFSALTNAAAFGSMWVSAYPGMASMGKMMALCLFCTMIAAVFFQPLLMGPPRRVVPHPEVENGRRDAPLDAKSAVTTG